MNEMNKEQQQVEIVEKVEELSLEELRIIHDAIGYVPVSLNNPAYPKLLELNEKIKRMYDFKQKQTK